MHRCAEPLVRHAASLSAVAALLLIAFVAAPAEARRSDRNQNMDVDAGQVVYPTDASGPTRWTHGVTITQGTLIIRADQADLHQTRGGDIARIVLRGSPATLRQELDDGTPMNVRANQIDYNHQTEVAVFTGGVRVEQPRGSMSGERVTYNMASGQVQGGGEGSGRVRMTIQPRAQQGGG